VEFDPSSVFLISRQQNCYADSKREESVMNNDIMEGNWKQLKGKVRENWGNLTDDEVDEIAGKKENFVGKIQEKYGMKRDEAEKEWDKLSK
tara:strand:- start:186 stop:458 length:273 start_codon:yes stop_codon:yes gene_type:complete